MKKPEITHYLNAHQFLQDYYHFQKSQNPDFSYDRWAQELGVNDKSYLRMMVLGKRPINEKMSRLFTQNMQLSANDVDYFSVLVLYTQSKNQQTKTLYGKKLVQLLKGELDQIEIQAELEFLNNPLLPRLHVFLTFQDLDQAPQNLAWLLATTESEITQALHQLLEMKLISLQNGRYETTKKSFRVPTQFGHLALASFYRQNLQAASQAIDLPFAERHFKSLFLPLNPVELEVFIKNLDQFAQEQLTLFNADEYQNRRLYQTHFNIIPVSSVMSAIPSKQFSKPSSEERVI